MNSQNPLPKRLLLWVRTVAGPAIGFGHLRRTLILAGMLDNMVKPHFLVDSGDVWAQEQATARGWTFSIFRADRLWASVLLPDGILIDTREKSGLFSMISEARRRRIPVASIHDLGLNPLPSDVVIDGSVARDVHTCAAATPYTGTSYLVLDPSYALVHHHRKLPAAKISSVIINLGGGDSSRFFPKVLAGLRLWGRELMVIGIPGFASWGQDQLESRTWEPLRFRWAAKDESIAELVFRADLAITAGGLSAFEALCSGTPLMALSLDAFQQHAVSVLAEAELCVDLGAGDLLEPERIPALLSSLEADRAGRERRSREGRRMIDGDGAKRVSRIIRQLITKRREHSTATQSSDRKGAGNSCLPRACQ